MNETLLIVIAAILTVLLIAMIIVSLAARKEQKRAINRMRQQSEQQARAIMLLNQSLAGVTERQEKLRDTLDTRIGALQQSNEVRLEHIRETVGEKLDGRLGSVNRQLADVHRGLGQMHELAGEFADLKKVLGGVKTRGIWGEMQLRALLEQTLAKGQYIENAAIPEGSQTRVEFAVRLPAADGEALLPIDSKFPQEDFIRLMDAVESGDARMMEICGQKLERALTEQAKLISEKYIRPPQTADFAVMFLPVESLYAEAVRRDGLCEKLQTKLRVLVAGPNTLAALLTSLRAGFRTVTLERRSGEVLKLLEEARAEFARFDEAVTLTRRRLEQTEDALNALEQKSRKLTRKLNELTNNDQSTT